MRSGVCVLLLEPESWRFTGIATFLTGHGITVAGQPECATSLQPIDTPPDAILLAHRMVERLGECMIDRIRELFPSVPLLLYGEMECVRTTAALLARGIQGYFQLSSPQSQLLSAIDVVKSGGVWAPRAALALLTQPGQLHHHDRLSAEPEENVMLDLLRDGLSNKEIASRLGLAEVTVKARLTRLYRRYGVRTRLQLLSSVLRNEAR